MTKEQVTKLNELIETFDVYAQEVGQQNVLFDAELVDEKTVKDADEAYYAAKNDLQEYIKTLIVEEKK